VNPSRIFYLKIRAFRDMAPRSRPTFQRCILPPSSGRSPNDGGSTHLWNGVHRRRLTSAYRCRENLKLYFSFQKYDLSLSTQASKLSQICTRYFIQYIRLSVYHCGSWIVALHELQPAIWVPCCNLTLEDACAENSAPCFVDGETGSSYQTSDGG
jgi:hypothetical protein